MTRGAVARCLRTVVLVIAASMGRLGEERGLVGREIVVGGGYKGYVQRRLVCPRIGSDAGAYRNEKRSSRRDEGQSEVFVCLVGRSVNQTKTVRREDLGGKPLSGHSINGQENTLASKVCC